jgi:hypothetical protein
MTHGPAIIEAPNDSNPSHKMHGCAIWFFGGRMMNEGGHVKQSMHQKNIDPRCKHPLITPPRGGTEKVGVGITFDVSVENYYLLVILASMKSEMHKIFCHWFDNTEIHRDIGTRQPSDTIESHVHVIFGYLHHPSPARQNSASQLPCPYRISTPSILFRSIKKTEID